MDSPLLSRPNSSTCILQLPQVELTCGSLWPHQTSSPGPAAVNLLHYKSIIPKRLPVLFTVISSESSSEPSTVPKTILKLTTNKTNMDLSVHYVRHCAEHWTLWQGSNTVPDLKKCPIIKINKTDRHLPQPSFHPSHLAFIWTSVCGKNEGINLPLAASDQCVCWGEGGHWLIFHLWYTIVAEHS